MNYIRLAKLWPLFRRPHDRDLARQELEDARIALLEAQTGLEWAKSQVQYNTDRIARLAAYVEGRDV